MERPVPNKTTTIYKIEITVTTEWTKEELEAFTRKKFPISPFIVYEFDKRRLEEARNGSGVKAGGERR